MRGLLQHRLTRLAGTVLLSSLVVLGHILVTPVLSVHAALPNVQATNPYTGSFGPPNCTWYAWQRLHDQLHIDLQFSAYAKDWIANLQRPNMAWSENTHSYVPVHLSTDHPQTGDIAIYPFHDGKLVWSDTGHVAYVEDGDHGDGHYSISQQSFGDTSPGPYTSPYPWVRHFDHRSVQSDQMLQQGQARFAHFVISGPPPAPTVDNARSLGQSANVTVSSGQAFHIYFVKQNTGTTTWSDAGGYTLRCVANCMGGGSAGLGGASVPPGHTFQFTLTLTAPSSPGSYASAWVPTHNGKQFGDATMFVLITVTTVCSASGLVPAPGTNTLFAAVGNVSYISRDVRSGSMVHTLPHSGCGGQNTSGCLTSPPHLQSPANGAVFPQSQYVRLTWSTACPLSYVELSGGPYGTLSFGGWHGQTQQDIGQMWPGTYTWHVNGGDQAGHQDGWSSSWTFVIGSSSSTGSGSSPTASACGGNGGVTLYADPNYSGACYSFGPGEYSDLGQFGLDLVVSSIRDASAAYHITLYDQKGLTGTPAYFDQDTPQMSGYWNDRARSMRIEVHGPPTTPTPTPTATPTPTPVPTARPTPTPATTIPAVPYPVFPNNGAVYIAGQSVTLYWNYHAYDDEAYVEVITPSGSALTFGWMQQLAVSTGPLADVGQYSWHVKARNLLSGLESDWSTMMTFNVVAPAPTAASATTSIALPQPQSDLQPQSLSPPSLPTASPSSTRVRPSALIPRMIQAA